MKRVLFFGRFQPFHNGHLRALRWLLERFDEAVVLVGMADESHTWRNPFTAGERLWMIHRAASSDPGLRGRIITATLPTLRIFKGNVSYVLSFAPPVDAVANANPPVARCFEETGVPVVKPPMFERGVLQGEMVRCMILLGIEEWRGLVPPAVAEVLDEIGAAQRLRAIASGDERVMSECRRLAQQR